MQDHQFSRNAKLPASVLGPMLAGSRTCARRNTTRFRSNRPLRDGTIPSLARRTVAAPYAAIGEALRPVTAADACGFFRHCGYTAT